MRYLDIYEDDKLDEAQFGDLGEAGIQAARLDGVAESERRDMKKATTTMKKAKSGAKDWRGETLARVRTLIKQADADAIEEVKWRKPSNPAGVPVWSHDGIICTGETYKDKVKLTFARGAALLDPSGLFNSSLDGNLRRAIDFHEGDKIDEKALKALIRAAVALNMSVQAKAGSVRSQKKPKRA